MRIYIVVHQFDYQNTHPHYFSLTKFQKKNSRFYLPEQNNSDQLSSIKMADLRRSRSNWSSTVKILLVSCCVVSFAVVLKLFVPLMLEFAVNETPAMWKSAVSWLKPPYLYIVINFIIITIAATSQLCHKHDEQNHQVHSTVFSSEFVTYEAKKIEHDTEEIFPNFSYEVKLPPVTVAITSEYSATEAPIETPPEIYVTQMPIAISPEFAVTETPHLTLPEFDVTQMPIAISQAFTVTDMPEVVLEPIASRAGAVEEVKKVVNEVVAKAEEEFVISRSNWSPPKRKSSSEFSSENLQSSSEKSLISSRFSHRKPLKSSPEVGKALKVTKAKRQQDTFESTWKTITEGRHMPLTRHNHRKSSDTFENNFNRQINMVSMQQDGHKNVMKSETFKDRTNNQTPHMTLSPSVNQLRRDPSLPSGGKLKKEASLSQDDLNRRVEAFINKFNEDMRLQRQESLNQYNEMMNRGAY